MDLLLPLGRGRNKIMTSKELGPEQQRSEILNKPNLPMDGLGGRAQNEKAVEREFELGINKVANVASTSIRLSSSMLIYVTDISVRCVCPHSVKTSLPASSQCFGRFTGERP